MKERLRKASLFTVIAYSIVIITFLTLMVFPLVFQYVDPFAAPSAVSACWIMNGGHIPNENIILRLPSEAVRNDMSFESQYPIPSVLLAIFLQVTGVPLAYAMFIPLAAIGSLIYFVLARFIINSVTKKRDFNSLLAAVFYAFITFSSIQATYAGRAVLGLMLFAFFLYFYLKLLCADSTRIPNSNRRSWIVRLLLLTLVIGETYYFGTFDAITIALSMLVLLVLSRVFLSWNIRRDWVLDFSIIVIGGSLFLSKEAIITRLRETTASAFFSNMIQYVGAMLGRLGINPGWINTQSTLWNIQLNTVDTISHIGERLAFAIQYSSIIIILAILIMWRPKSCHKSSYHPAWLFSLVLVFASIGELGYFREGPTGPLRLLLLYGPILTLVLVAKFISQDSPKITRKRISYFVAIFTIIVIILGSLGQLRFAWLYGFAAAKPFGYDKMYPLSEYLSSHTATEGTFTLAGDAYYTATIFFIVSQNGEVTSINPECLGIDAITLHNGLISGNLTDFLSSMTSSNVGFLLLVGENGTLNGDTWGSTWGYIIDTPTDYSVVNMGFSTIYTDGQTRLYQLPHS